MDLNCFGILAAGLLCASALSAGPFGSMSLASVFGGGVNLQGTRIDFFPSTNLPPNPPGAGQFSTVNPTNITYSGGTVTAASDPFGIISDLDTTPQFPVGGLNFILFSITQGGVAIPNLAFDITGIGPGGPAQGAINGCAGAGIGVPCSPSIGGGLFSPFVLTYNGVNTDLALSVLLNGRDATGSNQWTGGFQAQIAQLPGAFEAVLNSGGTITTSWSFTATGANGVPEPGTILIVGSGLMLIGLAAWRGRELCPGNVGDAGEAPLLHPVSSETPVRRSAARHPDGLM